ncbi:hypothetical protein L208DRAFT_1317027 [Tricholoma matsutake]|nr:hypothetical protein L208DRAFT_1317027 [Tricholoma matsutake 945]
MRNRINSLFHNWQRGSGNHHPQAHHQNILELLILPPTWIQRPPTNLGEPSHGKLKAQEYLTLFTCIFPLIIPEFWYMTTATNLHH